MIISRLPIRAPNPLSSFSFERPNPPRIIDHCAMWASMVIAPATRGGDARDQDVSVADVAQLVRQHARQLVAAEQAHDAGRHGHYGVVADAAGGEGVRRGAVDDGHPR